MAPSLRAPLVLFTYFNPIMRKGMDRFCAEIKAAGASGAPARRRRPSSSHARTRRFRRRKNGQKSNGPRD